MKFPAYRGWLTTWDAVAEQQGRWWRRLSPPQLFVGSFLLLILAGTCGLRWLPGLYTGPGLSWLDALFTATSAVCVTGLIVVDTATYFSPLGQAFLLLLIQLGGLGIITFTTIIILVLGRKLSLRQEAVSAAVAEVAPHIDLRTLTRNVLLFTFLLEGMGALVLFLSWAPAMGAGAALWPAIFHAVSAFCNAGFSTFGDSLMSFQAAPVTLLTIMVLIVTGGLGFLTIEELYEQRQSRRRRRRRERDPLVPRLSLHSRLVLATTAILVLAGWAFFTFFEWHVSFAGLPPWSRVLNGLFASVTARTAGFNTIDYGAAADGTNFMTILLMFVGGSPGSMAGGLKTTTIAVIGLLAWSRYRGYTRTSIMGRTIPEDTIQRAVGLFVVGFGVVTAAILVLTTTELGVVGHLQADADFLTFMFEAVSAFNTVGLSMGATSELSPAGRLVAIFLMYVGRVGPLTFAAAIALRQREPGATFRYAYEDVVIG